MIPFSQGVYLYITILCFDAIVEVWEPTDIYLKERETANICISIL